MDTVNTELIRGHVDTIILNALMQRDRYGYEILDMIYDLSEGRYEIKQPTLYSCLKRLEKQGFITSYYGDETQGGRRRYYKLTEKGRATLEQDQREWEFSRTIINRLLSDKEIDLRTVEAPFNPSELRPLTRRVRVYDDGEGYMSEDEKEESETPAAPAVTAAPETAETPVTPVATAETGEETSYVSPLFTPAVPAVNAKEGASAAQTTPAQPEAKPSVYDEEELLRIKEQQIAASKRLQIGEFASRKMLIGDDEDDVPPAPASYGNPRNGASDAAYGYSAPSQKPAAPDRSMFTYTTMSADKMPPKPQPEPKREAREEDYRNMRTTEEPDERLHYREALSALFRTEEPQEKAASVPAAATINEAEQRDIDNQGRARHFGDLKQALYEEGFNLKPYNKANASNFYYMKFVYSNKLMRDTMLLTYLVLVIEVLIMVIAIDSFAMNIGACIAIAAVGLLLPALPFVVWAINPTKRIKARFNLGTSITYALIAFIVISGISMIIALVAPSLKVDFTKGSAYIPVMIAALIPIAVLIYGLLYRSGNYHLKK